MKDNLLVAWSLFGLPAFVYWATAECFWAGGTPVYYAAKTHAFGLVPIILAAAVKRRG